MKKTVFSILSIWCFAFSSGGGSGTAGSVAYEGQTYRTVRIGAQTWMAENLNYNASGSVCYRNDASYCATYGRLYNWATAMDLPQSCNSKLVTNCGGKIQPKHRGICPEGWHIPTNADWDALYRAADGTSGTGSPKAGKHLKAKEGWSDCGPSGSSSQYLCDDTHGFSALPGGYRHVDGATYGARTDGQWWSANEDNSNLAYSQAMFSRGEGAKGGEFNKVSMFSVRCLQD